ncbi:hypothetical protein [Streptomyces cacaoi]|uniref:hypothetical protein n=1 Tax=Streptomyces cacaoi TaxID=1898 RepID=UPI00374797ED
MDHSRRALQLSEHADQAPSCLRVGLDMRCAAPIGSGLWLGLAGVPRGLPGFGQESVLEGGAFGGGVTADDIGRPGRDGMERDVQLVRDLVAAAPGFEDLFDAHVFNEDGVLPHVFFWDVVQETVASFLGSAETDWRVTLRFLEEQLRLDVPEVTQVITTSFLFHLRWPDQPGHSLVDHLGPAMSARFAAIRPSG